MRAIRVFIMAIAIAIKMAIVCHSDIIATYPNNNSVTGVTATIWEIHTDIHRGVDLDTTGAPLIAIEDGCVIAAHSASNPNDRNSENGIITIGVPGCTNPEKQHIYLHIIDSYVRGNTQAHDIVTKGQIIGRTSDGHLDLAIQEIQLNVLTNRQELFFLNPLKNAKGWHFNIADTINPTNEEVYFNSIDGAGKEDRIVENGVGMITNASKWYQLAFTNNNRHRITLRGKFRIIFKAYDRGVNIIPGGNNRGMNIYSVEYGYRHKETTNYDEVYALEFDSYPDSIQGMQKYLMVYSNRTSTTNQRNESISLNSTTDNNQSGDHNYYEMFETELDKTKYNYVHRTIMKDHLETKKTLNEYVFNSRQHFTDYSIDAKIPLTARFIDGDGYIEFKSKDASGNEDVDRVEIRLDNFRPFVSSVEISQRNSLGGVLGNKYSASWMADNIDESAMTKLVYTLDEANKGLALTSGDSVYFKIVFSEQMAFKEGNAKNPRIRLNGNQSQEYNLTPTPDKDNMEFTLSLTPSQTDQLTLGQNYIEIIGIDQAGNGLMALENQNEIPVDETQHYKDSGHTISLGTDKRTKFNMQFERTSELSLHWINGCEVVDGYIMESGDNCSRRLTLTDKNDPSEPDKVITLPIVLKEIPPENESSKIEVLKGYIEIPGSTSACITTNSSVINPIEFTRTAGSYFSANFQITVSGTDYWCNLDANNRKSEYRVNLHLSYVESGESKIRDFIESGTRRFYLSTSNAFFARLALESEESADGHVRSGETISLNIELDSLIGSLKSVSAKMVLLDSNAAVLNTTEQATCISFVPDKWLCPGPSNGGYSLTIGNYSNTVLRLKIESSYTDDSNSASTSRNFADVYVFNADTRLIAQTPSVVSKTESGAGPDCQSIQVDEQCSIYVNASSTENKPLDWEVRIYKPEGDNAYKTLVRTISVNDSTKLDISNTLLTKTVLLDNFGIFYQGQYNLEVYATDGVNNDTARLGAFNYTYSGEVKITRRFISGRNGYTLEPSTFDEEGYSFLYWFNSNSNDGLSIISPTDADGMRDVVSLAYNPPISLNLNDSSGRQVNAFTGSSDGSLTWDGRISGRFADVGEYTLSDVVDGKSFSVGIIVEGGFEKYFIPSQLMDDIVLDGSTEYNNALHLYLSNPCYGRFQCSSSTSYCHYNFSSFLKMYNPPLIRMETDGSIGIYQVAFGSRKMGNTRIYSRSAEVLWDWFYWNRSHYSEVLLQKFTYEHDAPNRLTLNYSIGSDIINDSAGAYSNIFASLTGLTRVPVEVKAVTGESEFVSIKTVRIYPAIARDGDGALYYIMIAGTLGYDSIYGSLDDRKYYVVLNKVVTLPGDVVTAYPVAILDEVPRQDIAASNEWGDVETARVINRGYPYNYALAILNDKIFTAHCQRNSYDTTSATLILKMRKIGTSGTWYTLPYGDCEMFDSVHLQADGKYVYLITGRSRNQKWYGANPIGFLQFNNRIIRIDENLTNTELFIDEARLEFKEVFTKDPVEYTMEELLARDRSFRKKAFGHIDDIAVTKDGKIIMSAFYSAGMRLGVFDMEAKQLLDVFEYPHESDTEKPISVAAVDDKLYIMEGINLFKQSERIRNYQIRELYIRDAQPPAVMNLRAGGRSNSVILKWDLSKKTHLVDKYVINRCRIPDGSSSCDDFKEIAAVANNVSAFTDTGVPPYSFPTDATKYMAKYNYKVVSHSRYGSEIRNVSSNVVTSGLQPSNTLYVHEGWNMIAFSAKSIGEQFDTIFEGLGGQKEIARVEELPGGDSQRMATWYEGKQPGPGDLSLDNPDSGLAYWAYSVSDTQMNIYGRENGPEMEFAIALDKGWNMIGNPYTSTGISFSDTFFKFRLGSEEKILSDAITSDWVDSILYKYQQTGDYLGISANDAGSPSLAAWQGHMLKTKMSGITMIISNPSRMAGRAISLSRSVRPALPPSKPLEKPVARLIAKSSLGQKTVVKSTGETFDVDLSIEADMFALASIKMIFDSAVIAPFDKTTGQIIASNAVVDSIKPTTEILLQAKVGNSIDIDIANLGSTQSGTVLLGTVTFKVLKSGETEIQLVSEGSSSEVFGYKGNDLFRYEVESAPVVFRETSFVDYRAPEIRVRTVAPAPPDTYIAPGAAAPHGEVSVDYDVTDNASDKVDVKIKVINTDTGEPVD